jgi:hypothetical protein
MRQKVAFLILTATGKQPKPKNQPAKQPKHEVREFKRPHPHKENKKQINKKQTLAKTKLLITNQR